MDFDANLLLNFVPIICASLLTFVTCFTVFYKLRSRWPVKVNCWFCNENSKVPRWTLDWWLCNKCNQYNGFSKDGDYKYEIPEQFRGANKNSNRFNESYCEKKSFSGGQNKLCSKCNRREELKLIKLRELEDSMDEFNDKQMIRFQENFEKKYPLCLKCQSVVQTVLYKQKLWLMQYKMLLFKQKPISKIIQNREKIERILRILLSVLASVSIYYADIWYLPLCGIAFQLAACLACPANRKQSDVFPILGWICLTCIRVFSITAILKLLQINFNSHWTIADDNTHQYFIITLGSAIGLINLKSQYHKTVSNKSLALKKLESVGKNVEVPPPFTPEPTMPQNQDVLSSSKESCRSLYSPVNITSSLMNPSSLEMPIPVKPAKSFNSPEWSPNRTSSFDAYPSKTSSFSSAMDNSFSPSFNTNNYSLNDSLTSLNSLSLGNQNKKVSPTVNSSQGIFETRVYGTSSPDLFTRNSRYAQQKRSILAPPRLRSPPTVINASWVAGGYWQSQGMGMSLTDMPASLSRSSSQSSGIGSCAGSMFGRSREPSFHELDQCSVVSSAEQQCCFARPADSTMSVASRSTGSACKRRNCSSSSKHSASPMTLKNEGNELSQQHQCHTKHDVQCSGHTTTIVMNPVWLPALLCGSLVLNMVVICTTLLR